METGDDKTSTADNQTVEAASTAAAPSFTEQLIQQVHQIKSDPDSSVVESSLDASVTYKTEVDEDAGQSEEKKSTDDQKEVASEPSSVSDEKKDEKKESDASTTEAKATESAKEPENEAKEEKKEDTINTESSLPSEAVKTVEEKKEAENTEVKDVEQKQEEKETKVEEKAAEDTKQAEQEQKDISNRVLKFENTLDVLSSAFSQENTEVKQEATTPETKATTVESNETSVNQLARTVSTSSNGESDAAIAQILLRLQVLLQRQNGIFATPLAAAAKPNAAPIQPPSDILIYNVLKQLLQRYGSTSLPPLNPATQTIVHENDTRQVLQFLHTVINTDTGSSSNDQTLLNNSISLDQVNRVLTHLIEIHQTEQANRPTEDLDSSLIKQVLKLLLQSFASTVAITNARNSNELQFFRCSSCQKVFVQVSYRFNKQ